MRIHLLGTGAADGIPAFFGNDPVSVYARQHGGKDIRSRSSALIDGVLKIDLPPETLHHLHQYRLDAREWTGLVFTHSHEDHFCPSELQYALYPFTELDHLPYTVYGNDVILEGIRHRYPDWPIELRRTEKFVPKKHDAYTITPIWATHKDDEECHNLIIEDGSSKLLYATDTGFYRQETIDFMANQQCDALVIECTEGFHKTTYPGHLDIALCVELVDRLRQNHALKPTARVVTTHHAASGGATHAQLEESLAPYRMEPGFDGMVIEI